MSKALQILLLLTIFLPLTLSAQWIPIDNRSSERTAPEVTLLEDTPSETIYEINIRGFAVSEIPGENRNWQKIDLLTENATTIPGQPEVPYIAKVLAIPDDAEVSVEIIEKGAVHKYKNIELAPARKSWWEGEEEPPYLADGAAYNSESLYPSVSVEAGEPAVFRDFRISRIAVYPVKYSPAKKELEITSRMKIKVTYKNGMAVNPKRAPKRKISPSFAPLYESFIFNYNSVLNRDFGGREDGYDLMLVIMPDEFYEKFQPYAEWQRKSGTKIHITKFSDIGASATDPTIIKDHISDAYYNWETPPSYVMIMGDDAFFPVKYAYYDYTFPNDDYFVEIDGDDYFPEMMIGRYTNQGDYRMEVMLTKTMNYERFPYIDGSGWFKKATCASNDAYTSQVECKRFTTELMIEDGGFTQVDTIMSKLPCPANIETIQNAINEGRSYLNYRGEGWSTGWNATCYDFHTEHVYELNNGQKLTFVTSIGCGVAMFTSSSGNCFGEVFIQLGSITAPRGAVAFVGPTSNTHTTQNNRIDKGIYTGMFQEGMDTPGQALLRGKLYVYNVFGPGIWTEYHYRVYTVLGDPSIRIWRDQPTSVEVTYPDEIPVGYSQVDVTVVDSLTGAPKAGAKVCLYSDDVYELGVTDGSGRVLIPVLPSTEGEVKLTVIGLDVIPHEGTINIAQAQENIAPVGEPVIVDVDYNQDGMLNPNETCSVTFELKNYGAIVSNSVSARLETEDNDLVEIISTAPVSFGDLTPAQSKTGDPFSIHIMETCPIDTFVTLKLVVSSSSEEWEYYFKEHIYGCNVRYQSYFIDDLGSANRNFRIDPGETVRVFLTLHNQGFDKASEVKGIIRTNNPHITIEDSVSFYDTIEPDSIFSNISDFYLITADQSFVDDSLAVFSLHLSTTDGFYPYSSVDTFKVPNGLAKATDPTGPDGYGYYAYSNSDLFYLQAPLFSWMEISDRGTQIQRVGEESDFTEIVDLPFNFQYYGNTYSKLSINSDGWFAFGEQDVTAPENTIIPNPDTVDAMVAVFWDDLFSEESEDTGKVFYHYDSENNLFIVEWQEVGHAEDYTNKETFEVILYDPAHYTTETGDGEIVMQYLSIAEEEKCTVGIENMTEDTGLQIVFNNTYTETASLIKNERAIKFTTEEPKTIITSLKEITSFAVPENYRLEQNYPNPFNPSTVIGYSIPVTVEGMAQVSLKIYDILGSEVATLVDKTQRAGNYEVTFDTGNLPNGLTSGVYFYRLIVNSNTPGGQGSFAQTKKFVLLK